MPGLPDRSRPRDLLAQGLTEQQHEAVFTDDMPLCILAGAGSGKTRVLTRRIARRIVDESADSEATLAVTFTRKAAGELSSRLRALGVRDKITCGTFHGVSFGFLREYWALRGQRPAMVAPNKGRILAVALSDLGIDVARPVARNIAAEIEWAKARLVTPASYEATVDGREPPLPRGQMAEVFSRYEAVKTKRHLVDFEDLLGQLTRVLLDDHAFAHTIAHRVAHVYVDEFQDVNHAQFRLLRAMFGGRSPTDLCVVGDDAQAIFGFSGADAAFLTEFQQVWPDASIVRLNHNFRCPPRVMAIAEAVLTTASRTRRVQSVAATATRDIDEHLPTVTDHESEEAEASWAAELVRRHKRARDPWSSVAILVRTNAQVAEFENALRRLGVPVRVGGASLLARPEVMHVLDRLEKESCPPGLPFSTRVAEICEAAAQEFAANNTAWSRDALNVIEGLAREYGGQDANHPGSFVPYVTTAISRETLFDRGADGVHVLTIHRAKGLEFDRVIVAGLEEGLLPFRMATEATALEEERRLFYVAMTRTRRFLHLSWARTRKTRADAVTPKPRHPSRFLDPVTSALKTLQSVAAPAQDWRTWLDTTRRELGGPAARPTEDVLEALQRWRARIANREARPAPRVLPDHILRSVALRRPQTTAELAELPIIDAVTLQRYGHELLPICA